MWRLLSSEESVLLYRALEVVVLSRLLSSSILLLYIKVIVSKLFVNNAIMIIVFDMWTECSIRYLFEFFHRQLSFIFLSFLCILINLFPFLNNIPVPAYDEFSYVWFFSHCKIAESIQIFHPTIFFHKTTKFCLTTRFSPVHMCVNFVFVPVKFVCWENCFLWTTFFLYLIALTLFLFKFRHLL